MNVWAALQVVVLSVVIVFASIMLASSLVQLVGPSFGAGTAQVHATGLSTLALAVMQLSTLFLTVLAAARPGQLVQQLGLQLPQCGRNTLRLLVAVMVVFALASAAISLTVFREQFETDVAHFQPMLNGALGWLAIACVVIGAPVSEEVLVRGFLLGRLMSANMPRVGAVLISNGLWTVLHAGYSAAGLIEVFLAGLILSAMMLMTRSILVPILAHAAHNVFALILMTQVAAG